MKKFKPTWLYIKQHTITGKLYFGKTTASDPYKYPGSGLVWQRHINKHGTDHVVTLYAELFNSFDECRQFALEFSNKMNIVESKQWANLKLEDGMMGGSYKYTADQKAQHSKNIKQKHWSGVVGDERRKLHSKKLQGSNNPGAKTYKIVTDTGEEFIVTGGLRKFCNERNLTYATVRNWINKGPIRKTGPKDHSFELSETKRRIIGWVIVEI